MVQLAGTGKSGSRPFRQEGHTCRWIKDRDSIYKAESILQFKLAGAVSSHEVIDKTILSLKRRALTMHNQKGNTF